MRKFRKELNAGTVSLVLLSMLDGASEPMYGYQIARDLESAASVALPVKQGTLYPVLRSLEAGGLLASSVEPSISGPPRRYYSITELGRATLPRWRATWSDIRDFVDAMLDGRAAAARLVESNNG